MVETLKERYIQLTSLYLPSRTTDKMTTEELKRLDEMMSGLLLGAAEFMYYTDHKNFIMPVAPEVVLQSTEQVKDYLQTVTRLTWRSEDYWIKALSEYETHKWRIKHKLPGTTALPVRYV